MAALPSFCLLAPAMKALPAGTAHAVWVEIGAVGAAVPGFALLGEPASLPRIVSILLILAGAAPLRLFQG